MKKVMLVLAAAMMLTAYVKAEGVENSNSNIATVAITVEDAQHDADTVNFNFRMRLRDLSKSLHLNSNQVEDMQLANRNLSRRIARLENTSESERQHKLMSIVAENLSVAHEVLDEVQYHTYLNVLNNEFNKAGLNSILYGYDQQLAEK